MPGFLYYLPQQPVGPDAELLRRLGLGHALAPQNLSQRRAFKGPDGGEGLLVADSARLGGEQLAYLPDQQSWAAMGLRASTSAAWLGYYTAAPPGPDDLARGDQLRGHYATLLDGRQWLVPVARGYTDQDGDLRWYQNLPRRLALDAAGKWSESQVLACYAPLWDLAVRWDDARSAAALEAAEAGRQSARLEFDEIIDGACLALGANYALGPWEASLLGLLSTSTAVAVLDCLVDMPTRLEWIKKKLAAESAGFSTSAGEADSIPPTAQP